MAIDIGLIAYNTYTKTLCLDSECKCEPWSKIGKCKQDAWRHAAVAVLQHIDEARKQMEEHPEIEG